MCVECDVHTKEREGRPVGVWEGKASTPSDSRSTHLYTHTRYARANMPARTSEADGVKLFTHLEGGCVARSGVTHVSDSRYPLQGYLAHKKARPGPCSRDYALWWP